MYSLQSKVVVVTGASSGIGEDTAYAMAAKQAHLVLAARNAQALERVKNNCIQAGAKAIAVVCDVSVQSDCEKLMASAIQSFGRIDVLINNAGISMRALFAGCDLSVLHQLMNTNFWGSVYCTRYAIDELIKNNGSVIGISSVAGFVGLPARSGYSASKFALHGFYESLRTENMRTGLHVGIICPGYTQSNIRQHALNSKGMKQAETPLNEKQLMPAKEVANRIVMMVEQRQNFVVLSSEGKLAYWINKLFPMWLSKRVYKKIAKEKDSPF
jgi:short-subunit dehydrogenase